jgi:tRNA pseudouridine65 synthase
MSAQNGAVPRLLGAKEGILAVYKPAGVLAHPSAEGQAPDLISWLRDQGGALRRALPAHRLDLETSGVVLCAPDPEARAALGRAFEDGLIHKTYLAVVIGRAHEKGVIRRPLEDARRGQALDAVTRYRLVEALGGFSLLSLHPETGRKHQLRRHLQGIGLPIVGDTRYPPPRRVKVPGYPHRLWLHAQAVELPSGARFECALPVELEESLKKLREGAASATPSPNEPS